MHDCIVLIYIYIYLYSVYNIYIYIHVFYMSTPIPKQRSPKKDLFRHIFWPNLVYVFFGVSYH